MAKLDGTKFRVVRTQDLKLIQEINLLTFPTDLPIQDAVLETSLWWVIERTTPDPGGKGRVVGFAGLAPDSKDFQLVRAGILPDYRGRGLQRRLIKVRVAAARAARGRDVLTYVNCTNVGSMRSLVREGFVPYKAEVDSEKEAWVYLGKSVRRGRRGKLAA